MMHADRDLGLPCDADRASNDPPSGSVASVTAGASVHIAPTFVFDTFLEIPSRTNRNCVRPLARADVQRFKGKRCLQGCEDAVMAVSSERMATIAAVNFTTVAVIVRGHSPSRVYVTTGVM